MSCQSRRGKTKPVRYDNDRITNISTELNISNNVGASNEEDIEEQHAEVIKEWGSMRDEDPTGFKRYTSLLYVQEKNARRNILRIVQK